MNAVLRAAWVIGRRDFTALIRSKAFIFFLIGPIMMLVVALAAGGVGAHMASEPKIPVIAVAMANGETDRLLTAADRLSRMLGGIPALEKAAEGAPADLARSGRYAAILSGSLDHPRLDTTKDGIEIWPARVRLLVDTARHDSGFLHVGLDVRTVAEAPRAPAAAAPEDRSSTAQFGQTALFLSTMLLAGMVLSNLVEEKTNKIIEVLASAIPLESIFLGKLFAMLAMALIAIAVWVGLGLALVLLAGSALPALPVPAVGWPLFLVLGVVYFSTAYLLLGSAYLGIGAMAATVRDVQTLSMPVSMAQLGVFLAATYAMSRPGSAVEMAACLFPFTSPFALLAHAAQAPQLWPHLVAVVWQGAWCWGIVRIGTGLFRRNVLKSRVVRKKRAG